jgi:hypothetical protein
MIMFSTEFEIRNNLKTLFPAIKSIVMYSPKPGTAVLKIKLKWWSWFALGYLHDSIRLKIGNILKKRGAACVIYNVMM